MINCLVKTLLIKTLSKFRASSMCPMSAQWFQCFQLDCETPLTLAIVPLNVFVRENDSVIATPITHVSALKWSVTRPLLHPKAQRPLPSRSQLLQWPPPLKTGHLVEWSLLPLPRRHLNCSVWYNKFLFRLQQLPMSHNNSREFFQLLHFL